ncbi:MAG TPA: thioesterase domain-containing protein, partial [Chloroflexota bacterium]|nr:thioesterase domain-containing protein [Chloroflexota bacterium]
TLARLAHFLGTDQPFYGLQPPAVKEGASAPQAYATVKDLAGHYLATLRQVQPEGPYVLAGYDVGGILAFEIACQLKQLKQEVALLALLDTPFLAANPMFYLSYRMAKLAESSRETLTRPQSALLKSGPAERIRTQGEAALRQLATRFPAPVTRLREGFVAVQEAIQEKQEALKDWGLEKHLRVIQRYVPAKYEGRVTLFLATESPVRLFGAVAGWNSVAIQGVGDHLVPGTHETMLREPRVEVLAQQLQACLPR